MEVFLKGVSFHGVMLDELFSGFFEMKKTLHDAIAEGIATGAMRPLPRTVFPHSKVEQAFRYSFHDGERLNSICKD
jgi:fatty acid synthase